MIHNIVQVKSIKPIKGKKGTYSSVTWQDGDKEFTKNVFEPAHQKIFKQALESGESVDVAMEKENDYWNVKSAEITSADVGQTTEREPVKQTKTWKPRSPEETHSIERQTKVKETGEEYRHCTESGVPWNADLYREIYRDIAEVMARDGLLVNEAKKMGAVEVDNAS